MDGLKAAARVVRNYAKGYSIGQAKVYDVTSNDPEDPSAIEMDDIAQLTHYQDDVVDIMETLEKRLIAKGKDWRRVCKGLTLLDHLLRHGSEDVLFYYSVGTTNRDTINTLRDFEYIEDGKDRGLIVRQKANVITILLQDEGRLRTERRAWASMRERRARGGAGEEGEFDEYALRQRSGGADDDMRWAIVTGKASLRQRQKLAEKGNAKALFDDQQQLASPPSNVPFPFLDAPPPQQMIQQQQQDDWMSPQMMAQRQQQPLPPLPSFSPTNLLLDEGRLRTDGTKLHARANPRGHYRITNGTTANGYPDEKSASSLRRAIEPSLPQDQIPEPTDNADDDEDVRRAIELSMQEQQKHPEDVDLRVALEASLFRSQSQRARDGSDRPGEPSPPPYTEYDHSDLRRAIELSREQPEDVDLRRAIEASLLARASREGVAPPRSPSYATRYTHGMHDVPSTTGSENHVSAGSFLTERHSLEPTINGISEHEDRGLLDLHDDGRGQYSGAHRREPEPNSLPETTQVPSPISSTGSSPRSPKFVQAVSPDIPSSLPEKRSPTHEVDPDIRVMSASEGSSSGEDSSLEDPLSKSGDSSGARSLTPVLIGGPSPSPKHTLVPPTASTAAAKGLLPQLSPPPPQEQMAEQTADDQAMSSVDNIPSATESENNVYVESSEGLPSWQTEAYIDSLLASWERRRPLLSMVMSPDADNRRLSAAQVRQRLAEVEAQMNTLLIYIIGSREARHAAQRLESERAQSFVDVIQDALDRGTFPNSSLRSKARHLMQKVSEAVEQLPSSLFIDGVNDRDEHPTFGGGFGDVYQASYQGKTVALKRIRTFTADSTTHRHRLQFYKEALVWQGLRHRFILPLLGIDRSTFAPSFCMVSPWMKYGTVLKYLRDHGRGNVNRLLLEISQGLDYLHSMNVVHGDLRGNNILISDDGNACLSDFGLATSIVDADSTIGVTSTSNRAGSSQWFAPELIHPTKFGCTKFVRTKASDVYAYACVCLELYTGNPPFPHLREIAASLRVIDGERPEQPLTMPATLWQVVTSAWVEDFRARPAIHDIAVALEGIP